MERTRSRTEKTMATHSSTLAWKIPWTEEPGRLQSMGSLGVWHNWATSLSLSLSCIGEGNGNPLQCSCLENARDGGAWWAAVYGVAQSRTRPKWLSSSSSRFHNDVYAVIWDVLNETEHHLKKILVCNLQRKDKWFSRLESRSTKLYLLIYI